MSIRIVIADSQPVVRAGLFSFFRDTDIEIIGETWTAEQLLTRCPLLAPDVVLMDTIFPDADGFETASKLRQNGYKGAIIFFSDADRTFDFARAEAIAADSYLLKKTSRAELIRSLRLITGREDSNTTSTDERPFPGELRRVACLKRNRPISNPFSPLTRRESQVLTHVAFGLSNKEIASSLGLSLDTVKEHVRNILRKLEVKDRTEAAVWAIRTGLIG